MLARRRACVDLGLPYLVAEVGGAIAGFAYAGLYRSRPAYRYAIEDSVYVADGQTGRGIGSALLGELIDRCLRFKPQDRPATMDEVCRVLNRLVDEFGEK